MSNASTKKQRIVLATVTALHAALGSWVATLTPGPLLVLDDLAYLAMGRTIAGFGAAPLAPQPPYGVLYSLFLAPGWLLAENQAWILLWARVVNGMLGAALIPVLYVLVRRFTGASSRWSLVAAIVGASLPAHMAGASIVWTERLLPLLIALVAWFLIRFVDRPSTATALTVVAAALALYASHPRLGVSALVLILAVGGIARYERLIRSKRRGLDFPEAAARIDSGGAKFGWVKALLISGVGLGGLLAVERIREVVATATFADGGIYNVFDLAGRRGLDQLPDMLIRASGTIGYLMLATAGFAIIGVIVLLRAPPVGPCMVIVGLVVVAVGGWFLSGAGRADTYLHGRYIEVLAPLLVALGVIGVSRMRAAWVILAMAGSVVISGLWGAWAGPGNNWNNPRSPIMMLGTEAAGAPFGNRIFEPGAAALLALIIGGVLLWAFRRSAPWLGLGIALLVLSLGSASALESLDHLFETATLSRVQEVLADLEIAHVVVDVEGLPRDLSGAVAWEVGFDNTTLEIVPDSTHLLLRSSSQAPNGAEVVANIDDATLWVLPN